MSLAVSASNPRAGERRGVGLVLADGLKMGATGVLAGAPAGAVVGGLVCVGLAIAGKRHSFELGPALLGSATIGAGVLGSVGALLGMSGLVSPFRNEG